MGACWAINKVDVVSVKHDLSARRQAVGFLLRQIHGKRHVDLLQRRRAKDSDPPRFDQAAARGWAAGNQALWR